MSERKVLNKYYPPDFDPAKIPKLRLQRERQYTVRIMAPFNMRCKTCGDYIYQGKKFNAKTENVQDEKYLGLRIYRFYIKCPKCISEISFKTDPENEDYALEHGATRLFEAAKMLRKATEKEKLDREEEEANNPMKVLENRTKDSKHEMEILENLEELKEINTRKVDIDYAEILRRKAEASEEGLRRQEEEDEAEVQRIFGKPDGGVMKRLQDDSDDDDDDETAAQSPQTPHSFKRPTDILTNDGEPQSKKAKSFESKSAKISSRSALAGLVKLKNPVARPSNSVTETSLTSPSPQTNQTKTLTNASTGPSIGREPVAPSSQLVGTSQAGTSERKEQESESSEIKESESSEIKESEHQDDDVKASEELILSSIQEGLGRRQNAGGSKGALPKVKAKSVALSLLGGYVDSDESDETSD